MHFNLVYGRSGTGKSNFIYNDIKKKLEEDKEKKIFVIVPEQSNMSAERKLLEITGQNCIMNTEVLTLSRMAYRVLLETENTLKPITKIGKSMLIFDLISKEKANLNFLGKSMQNVDVVDRLFTELKKHDVSKDSLDKLEIEDKYFSLKLNDIKLLYEDYNNRISEKLLDENDALSILCDEFDKTNMFDNVDIYIDDFLGFTKQEYRVFEKIATKANSITVCVPTDTLFMNKEKENDIFYFNKKFANKLLEIVASLNGDVSTICLEEPYRFKSEELKFLEKNFESNKEKYEKEPKDIKLFLANNPYTELAYVADNIYKLVKEEGYSYNEIGIISENVESYSEDAKALFPKYNIPLFIDEKKELNQNLLIRYIISLIDIFVKNFSYDSVFNFLKIGLSDYSPEELYYFENYCQKWGIRNNKFKKEFTYEEESQNQQMFEAMRKEIIDPLITFKEKVDSNKTYSQISKAIYEFLDENEIIEKLDKKLKEYDNYELFLEYNTTYSLLNKVFDEMDVIFKDEKTTFEKYKDTFLVGIGTSELGKIPSTQEQVIFGDTDRTRNSKIRALFIVGANDGYFPKEFKSEGYLNDDDRSFLKTQGVELAKDSVESLYEEQFNIYRALTTPEEKLFISYSSSDKEGNALRKSSLIKKMRRLFENLKEDSDVVEKRYEITNENASFENALENYRNYLDGENIGEKWEHTIRYFYNKDSIKLNRILSGKDYTNKADKLSKENVEKLYGKRLYTTISRLENYRRCPFSFHLNYGLKLKEKNELKIQTVDTGSFMHEVIDELFRRMEENEIDVDALTDEDIKKLVDDIVNQMLISSRYYLFTSSEKYKLLTRRLKKVVYQAIIYIIYSLKNSDFKLLGHELAFGGKGASYDSIKIDFDDKHIELSGKIDRVDTAKLSDEEYIRIIDYKSSVKDLDLNQVLAGLQIQLITYLDAACKERKANPSGVLYLGLIDNVIRASKNLSVEEIEAKIKQQFRMKGLVLADINVIKMMDKNIENGKQSDIIPVYLSKDGEITKKSNAVNREDFERLTKKVKEIIKELSKEILEGSIDIKPYKYNQKTGCDYCSYKSICMFNTLFEGNDYYRIPKKEKELLLEEIREKYDERIQ